MLIHFLLSLISAIIYLFKIFFQNFHSNTNFREGPALNICIERKNTRQKVPCMPSYVSGDPIKILDADFTLALRCPKFPRDGKCM